jgi:autotransporter translocation and assembly factor TamB
MKRALLYIGATIVVVALACAALAGPLLRWGVNAVEAHVAKETNYELHIRAAHLHVKSGLVLKDLSVQAKNSDVPLLSVRELAIRPRWRALLRRELVIETVQAVEPRLSINESVFSGNDEGGGLGMLKEIHRIDVQNGYIAWNSTAAPVVEVFPVDISGSLNGDRLSIASYALTVASQTLTGDGEVLISSGAAFDLSFHAREFVVDQVARRFTAFPETVKLTYTGDGRVSGTSDELKVASQGRTAGGAVSFVWVRRPRLQTIDGTFKKIALDRFVTNASVDKQTQISGCLQARSALDWNSMTRATATVYVDGFMPNKVRTSIALSGTVALNNGRGTTDFTVKGAEILGHVAGKFATATGAVDARFDLSTPRIQSLQPFYRPIGDCAGSLKSSGTVSGLWRNPLASISILLTHFDNATASIKQLNANLHSFGASPPRFAAAVSLEGVHVHRQPDGTWDLRNAQVEWSGGETSGNIRADVLFKNKMELHGAGPLSRAGDAWKWTWTELGYSFKKTASWSANPGGVVDYSPSGGITVTQLVVPKDSGMFSLQHFHWNAHHLEVKADAKKFPLDVSIPISSGSYAVKGVLDAKVIFSGTMTSAEGKIDVLFSSGSVNGHGLRKLVVDATIGNGAIRLEKGEIQSTLVEEPARFHGNIPWHWIVAAAPEVPADVTVSFGPVDPAGWIDQIPHASADKGGSVRFDGHISGRHDHILIEGSLVAALSHVKLSDYNLDLRDISIDIQNRNEVFQIKKGSARMGKKGNIQLSGQSQWPHIQLQVSGKNIQFKVPRRLEFLGDADLALTGTVEEPDFSGKIHVTRGMYQVPAKKKKEAPAGAPPSRSEFVESFWNRVKMKVAADWSNAVWYRDGLTKIETEANLEVLKDRWSDDVYLIGSVSLLRGSYDAYGRDFLIKSGDLQFHGPPGINPSLQVEAEYQTADVVIDAQVSGTSDKPQIAFQSTPPMTQPEILSVLATGVSSVRGSELTGPSNGVSPGAGLAADVLSNYLTTQVRTSGLNVLSLDVLRITPTATGNVWTVGRYLGPRFFFSYSTNSKDTTSRVLNGEYFLSSHWSVVGQTGSNTDNYMDLQFRVPWPRKSKVEVPAPTPIPLKK